MAVLSMLLLLEWLEHRRWSFSRRTRAAVLALVVGLVSLSSVFHWLNSFRKTYDHDGEMFVERGMVEALGVIADAPPGGGTVLARFETGNYVPRFTGKSTVVGSRGQTGNFDQLLASTDAFYRGEMSNDQMATFLEEQRVDWIVIGPHEAAIMAPDLRMRLAYLNLQSWYRDTAGHYEVLTRLPPVTRARRSLAATDGQ
jgi:hypothetical protein